MPRKSRNLITDPQIVTILQEFEKMSCKTCRAPFQEGDKFCMCCGARVKMPKLALYNCKECGEPIPEVRYWMDTREHCPHCGKLSKVQEKRQIPLILTNVA